MSSLSGLFAVLCGSCLLPGIALGQGQSMMSVSSQTGQSHSSVVYQKKQQSVLKSMIKTMVPGGVIQNQLEISRSVQGLVQELSIPTPVETEEEAADPLATVLAYAWQEYRLENYIRSKELFLQAAVSDNVDIRASAEYGLAYSYLKLGDTGAAFPLLQQFVAQGKQLESTAAALAAILFERGDFTALYTLLSKLPPAQAKEWQARIFSARFQQDIVALSGDPGQGDIEQFIQKNRSFLTACRQQELFFRLAVLLVDNNLTLSENVFADLSQCNLADQAWQKRVLREQLHLLSNEELLAVATTQHGAKIAEQSRKSLLREVLWRRFDQLEKGTPEYESFVQVLYAQDPNNPEAAALAAWSCYQRGDYKCAEELFYGLVRKSPSDDALLGLVYSLQQRASFSEALDVLAQHPEKNNTTFNQLRFDLHATLGGNLYQRKRYEEAVEHLQQALIYQPEDMDLTDMILWSRYHLGEIQPLTDSLWQQYEENNSADIAKVLSDLLEKRNDPVFTRKVMERYATSDIESVQKLAGDYVFGQKHPVLANQIYQGQSPYAGSAVPALNSMFLFRSKGGDAGTSKLNVATLMLKQQFSTTPGKIWSAALFPLYLDSGALPQDLPVGTAFRHLQGMEGDPEAWQDHALTWGWRGGLQIEGETDWEIEIGSTPLGGIVAPTVVGTLQGSGSDWLLAVERDPVRDSMLSWIGQTDPYSDREWGRIVQTGLRGARTISLSDWWLTFEGEYAWYQGENVEENSSLTASVSGGATSNWGSFDRSTGLFLFARGFNLNSNFYTFGHGGYYSPATQIIAGPFFRLVTTSAHSYWLDASLSAGLNYRKTDDAPHYTELGSLGIDASDPAWQDVSGVYQGETETGLGVDARIRGLVPLSKGWFVGGEATVNNVDDFTQWQVAVLLRYRFGEGMGLGLPERAFSMLMDLVQ